jgi:uncharacterized protein YbaP (TraB family)
MRRTIAWLAVLPCWLLLSSLALAAAAPATGLGKPSVDYGDGLLFELMHPDGGPPSYLFGTIHSEDPRVLALPAPVTAAMGNATTLVLEVIPDAAAMGEAATAMRLADGVELRDLLTPELYHQCQAAMAERGLPEAILRDLKPWAVMTLVMMPEGNSGEFLDKQLYRLALADGKQTLALETVAEQLSLFEQLTLADQQALLDAALAVRGERARVFAELIDAYLRGALGELLAVSDTQLEGLDPALELRFRNTLIDARNARMLQRIEALPEPGGYFIAVGALHLPGRTGLLRGLRDAGYGVRRLH